MQFPRMLLVKQNFPDRSICDIPAEVRDVMTRSGFAGRLPRGSRIAIGVGSRGIANIDKIAGAVVAFWKSQGMQPYIFPAMGSHGAATAEGQAEVLMRYGIDERTMGCPIISSLDVEPLGTTPEGIEVFMDRHAFNSDAVFLMNRIKWHTDFAGKIESGLFKMMAIGIGKFAGAQRYHAHAYKIGLEEMVRRVGRQVLSSGKILGGLAIIEDANHNTAKLVTVQAGEMERREEELLELVKSWAGRIPVPQLDILILDEIGKHISGAGMDTKIVNRSIQAHYNPFPNAPRVERIFLRGLSEMSHGNAVGIGLADIMNSGILPKVDWPASQVNCLTASTPMAVRIPINFPADRECLEKIAPTVGKFDARELTIGWIRNTLQLNLLCLSETLLSEIQQNPNLEVIGSPRKFEFDSAGNLISPLAPKADWASVR